MPPGTLQATPLARGSTDRSLRLHNRGLTDFCGRQIRMKCTMRLRIKCKWAVPLTVVGRAPCSSPGRRKLAWQLQAQQRRGYCVNTPVGTRPACLQKASADILTELRISVLLRHITLSYVTVSEIEHVTSKHRSFALSPLYMVSRAVRLQRLHPSAQLVHPGSVPQVESASCI